MASNKSNSTLKFFLEWAVDLVKGPARWFIVTGTLAALTFGANEFLSPHPKAPVAETGEEAEVATAREFTGNRAPGSIGSKIMSVMKSFPYRPFTESGSPAGERVNEQERARDEALRSRLNYTDSSATSDSFQNIQGGGAPGAPSLPSVPSKLSDTSSTDSPFAAGGGGGSRSLRTTSSPIPTATGGGAARAGNGVAGTIIPPTAGFQAVSGGEFCTASGMRVRVSIGGVTDGDISTGTGMKFVSGLEGIYNGR